MKAEWKKRPNNKNVIPNWESNRANARNAKRLLNLQRKCEDAPHARRRPNPLATPQLYAVLNHLNRGYGTVLISLDNLELMNTATRPEVLPADCLRDLRNRMEELRAQANRELLAVLAGHKERDAAHFGRSAKTAKHRS